MTNVERPDDRKINLLIVLVGLGLGGAEVVAQRIAQTIDRRRFNVTICCLRYRGPIGEQLAQEGADVVVLSNGDDQKASYFTFVRLLRLIKAKHIDVVHTHAIDALADAALCKLLRPGLKLIHTFHFGNYPHRPRRHMWIERVSSRLADRLVAVGETQRKQLKAAFGFTDGAIGRVWNGVRFPANRDGRAFRQRLDAGDRMLVGVVATLIEQKGLFDFLAAAVPFRRESDRIHFVIIGDGHLRPELERKRTELGLQGMVTITGLVPNAAEVAVPALDIFFQPSLWEAMSIALLEAMAAGKPIVATRVGETPYIIDDGVDGLLTEPRDVDAMVSALRRLIGDDELRRRLGDAASDKVRRRYSVASMTRAYEEIYNDSV